MRRLKRRNKCSITIIVAALNRVCEWPYRTRVRLTDTGDYRVVIRPVTPQQGIEAVGINIVKTQ